MSLGHRKHKPGGVGTCPHVGHMALSPSPSTRLFFPKKSPHPGLG